MTDQVAARLGESADHEIVDQLRVLATEEAMGNKGGALLVSFDRAIVEDSTLLVGTLDGVVVGYATVTPCSRGDVRIASVKDLFVHPEAREVGVAAAMLSAAVAFATDDGCTHIESEVLPGNRAAKNFFERMGMVTRKLTVSRPIAARQSVPGT